MVISTVSNFTSFFFFRRIFFLEMGLNGSCVSEQSVLLESQDASDIRLISKYSASFVFLNIYFTFINIDLNH